MSTTNKSNKTFGLSVWAINNRTIIYVLMGVFLLLGGTAYVTMPRENFPCPITSGGNNFGKLP